MCAVPTPPARSGAWNTQAERAGGSSFPVNRGCCQHPQGFGHWKGDTRSETSLERGLPMAVSTTENGFLQVQPDLIPQELKDIPQWVCWKLNPPNNGKKARKLPINPRTGDTAAIDDPSTWTTFEEAYSAYLEHSYDGVWLALTPEIGLVAFDFDDCVRNNHTPDWLTEVINQLQSYTELSPSGKGIRIICRGRLPEGRRRVTYNGILVEAYDRARFISLTGWQLKGAVNSAERRQMAIELVYHRIFGEQQKAEPARPGRSAQSHSIEAALGKDHLFCALWNGADYETLGYLSQSEADAALMHKLWFWSGGDRERTLELFRQSAYGQREKAQRDDYLQRTLDAVASGDVYKPKQDGNRLHPGPDKQLAKSTIPPELSNLVRPLNTVEPRPVEWLIPNLLARGEITILAGEAGVGKTTLALEIAHGLTKRASILDQTYQPIQARVCWLHFDHSAERLREKYEIIYGEPPNDLFMAPDLDTMEHLGMLPLSQQTLDMWVYMLEQFAVEVLVVDTLLDLFQLDDSDKTSKAQAAMQSLRTLVERTGVAVLAIAHPNKAGGQRRVTSLANSLAFGAKADVVAFLTDDDGPLSDGKRCILRVVKSRSGDRWESVYERRGGNFVPVYGEAERPRTLSERIVDFIKSNGPSNRQTLLDVFKEVSGSTLDRQLKSLVKQGVICETRGGRNNLSRVYYLPHQKHKATTHSQNDAPHSISSYICNNDELDELDENGNSSVCKEHGDNNPISSSSSCVHDVDEIGASPTLSVASACAGSTVSPPAGDESGALGHTFQRVVFLRPSDETGEFVHTRVVFHPPTDDLGR